MDIIRSIMGTKNDKKTGNNSTQKIWISKETLLVLSILKGQ